MVTKLTPREIETLGYLAKGLLYKEIADRMGISEGNLRQKVHTIYQKLNASNRTEALNIYRDTNES